MAISFIHSFQSEWLKKKRSLASWIVVVGGFFTPAIIIIARLVRHDTLQALYSADGFWKLLWKNSWESMAIFLLPLGVILATSLITQIEYKNNTWKQLHTLPLNLTTTFFSKLVVIIVMMVQFFILFNIGIYLSAVVPYLLVSGVPYPHDPFPTMFFLKENMFYFIDCLPDHCTSIPDKFEIQEFSCAGRTGILILDRSAERVVVELRLPDPVYLLHVQLFEGPARRQCRRTNSGLSFAGNRLLCRDYFCKLYTVHH